MVKYQIQDLLLNTFAEATCLYQLFKNILQASFENIVLLFEKELVRKTIFQSWNPVKVICVF